MRKLLFAATGFAGALALAEPVDGYQWGPAWYAPYSALSPQYWQNGVVAKDGGIAYFLGTQSPHLAFSSATTWRGIDFGNVMVSNDKPVISGGPLTLTGDAFISGSGFGSTSSYGEIARVNATVSGTGANTLTKQGYGILSVNVPFANFSKVLAGGGFLRETAFSDATLFATEGTAFAVRGGAFEWLPGTNAADPSDKAAQGTMGAVTYSPLGGALAWAKGENDSATLTLASLSPEAAAGNTLTLEPSGGAASLGESERLVVAEPPETANGMLDPGIVVREKGEESAPIRFTAYDAEKGVVAYPVSAMKPLAEAGEGDVAVVTASGALEVSKRVAALSLENTAGLAISNGVTLTVGDGVHAAGVAINCQSRIASDDPYILAGAGTLDFGTSPGVIWGSSPSFAGTWGGNRRIQFATRIAGSAGVTFAGRPRENGAKTTPLFLLNGGAAAWTGPTRISGAMLWCNPGDLPDGDVYAEFGSGFGGSLRFETKGTVKQNIFLSGRGVWGDSVNALELPSGFTDFTGEITLTDDAWIGSMVSGAGGWNAYGPVKGPGSLNFGSAGTYNFRAVNSYRDLNVLSAATAVNLIGEGTFGTGRVWVRAKNLKVGVQETANLVVTNAFRCDAEIAELNVDHAKVAFDTSVGFAKTTVRNFSTVGVGGRVDLGQVEASGANDAKQGKDRVVATQAGAELLVGTGADGVLGLPLSDGEGTLALTKKGAATVELPAVERAYTGATKVEAGTLRLNDDPLGSRSIVWWLDASREEDFTKTADGVITEWRPRAGSGNLVFTETTGKATWGTAAKVNGHDVVSMSSGAQFKGSKKAWHRTVFIVCRFTKMNAFACLFGAPSSEIGECGVRISASSNPVEVSGWDLNNVAHYDFNTTGSTRQDAGTSWNVRTNEVHVLTTVHDRDNWPTPFSWAYPTTVPHFTPLLNYYGASRPFVGDYMEVIAYDRVLTEAETRRVENYLSEKWQGVTRWRDDQVALPAALPEATSLEVATGATLDLNGVSATVASLSGNGTVTNSSAKAATLTVTGASTFTGRIGGATTVRAGGEVALGASVGAGATFEVAGEGASLAVQGHLLAPLTNGLAYWCDAGRPETIVTNAKGGVSAWLSRADSSAGGLVNDGGRMLGTTTQKAQPTFTEATATALDGRPGVRFEGTSALWADKMTPVRTVFVVASLYQNQSNCNGLWGLGGYDCGFRFSNGSTSLEGSSSVVRPTTPDDRVRLDGAVSNNFGLDAVRVFSARMDSTNAAYYTTLGIGESPYRTTVVGAYCGNPSVYGCVGEVIAYDRVLSDSEMLAVENYLMNKWQKSAWAEGRPPAETEAAFAGGALAVGAGASAAVPDGTRVGALAGGGALSGDVVADGFSVTVKPDGTTDTLTVDGTLTFAEGAALAVSGQDYLTARIVNTYLRATAIVGDFATTDLERRNVSTLGETEGRLYRAPGTLVIVR